MPPRKVPLPPPKERERRASAVRKSFVEPGENDLFDETDEPVAKVARAAPKESASAASSSAPAGPPITSARAAERLLAGETPLERCAIALDYLSSLDAEGWFQEPVTDEIAPGYSEFVQEPMDLGTVRQKLTDGEYGTDDGVVARFAADVRLVYRNAVT